MKKLFIISILALFSVGAFSQTILKKIDLHITALDKTAKVVEVTFIAKDQSFVKVNLYESAVRTITEIGDLDGNVSSSDPSNYTPINLIAKNRTFNRADAISLFGLTIADYRVFYPVVVVLSDEDIKAARIAELEAQIKKLTTELNALKS